MLEIMGTAQNAIASYNVALEAASSNIANMNVLGYKSLDVSFQSILERILSQGSAATATMGGTNPIQFGQGMSVSSTSIDFSQGSFSQGSGLDLAVNGQGLFIISTDGGSTYRYTRVGNFSVDSAGNLTSNNMQVFGLDGSNSVVPITNLPSNDKSSYKWLEDGSLQYTTDGGTTYIDTGYKIAMTYFINSSALAAIDGTSFAETVASGTPATAIAPGNAAGSVKPGYLEASNVNYLSETIYASEIQRAMSSNLSVVQMASDMISSFISKIG
ncbi:MAG: flagellar hook-basal body complex protein [Candidatus Margulisiibacteriota bacterium]